MTSMATTWCPSSFQLRLAFTCRKPTPLFVRFPRFHRLDCRFRVFCVDGNGSGNATESVRVENLKSSGDEFSGWSGVNGSESDESKGNKWNGGKIGGCCCCDFVVLGCGLLNYVVVVVCVIEFGECFVDLRFEFGNV